MPLPSTDDLTPLTDQYPDKFVPVDRIFSHIRRGDRLFIGTGCGEPQHLVQALMHYVGVNPKALFDVEILHVLTLGQAPYTDEAFRYVFRHNSFFLGNDTREAVNRGLADYTPISLSQDGDTIQVGYGRLQEFVVIDYTREMVILACGEEGACPVVVGLAEYYVEEDGLTANVAFAVRDRYQNQGIGTELLAYLTLTARKQGLHGFTAEVLKENEPMLRVFEKMRFPMESRLRDGVYELTISLK
jgi:GNAT superfamily N-acetyltransferase